MEPVIKIKHVEFYYDKGKPFEVHALKDINAEIQDGEYISFLGPSGCGKSTLLYLLAGVEKTSSGQLMINGQDLSKFSNKELAIFRQIGIGIIFQNFNLIPSIKNIENVTLPMTFLGLSHKKCRKRAMEVFERLGIADLAERYPFELSGGQQQRVGIARALANDPPIILADEPIGNLDSTNAENVLNLLKEINKQEGKIVILVTHEAWSLRDADRIFYMKDGAIVKVEAGKKPKEEIKTIGASHYLKNLFPEMPDIKLRAKTFASLILRGYSQPEVERFEQFLTQRFKKQINDERFQELLDLPFKQGGVGLWKQRAQRITNYVKKVMVEEKALEALYKKLEKNSEAPLYEEIIKVRQWLLDDFTARLTPLQLARLDEIIGERIRKIITSDNFRQVLDLGQERGGVGLRIRTSLKMSEKLEILLKGGEPVLIRS